MTNAPFEKLIDLVNHRLYVILTEVGARLRAECCSPLNRRVSEKHNCHLYCVLHITLLCTAHQRRDGGGDFNGRTEADSGSDVRDIGHFHIFFGTERVRETWLSSLHKSCAEQPFEYPS